MVMTLLERAATTVLCALLPAHFRDRQQGEWRGDLAELERRGARLRYLAAAALTLPSLYAAARRHGGPIRKTTPRGYGVRALTPPRDLTARTLIGLFALTTAMFAAACAGRLSWTPPPPLMSTAQAQALATTVFPGRAVTGSPDAPAFASDEDGLTLPGATIYQVLDADPGRDLHADGRGALDRLRAQGWTIDTKLYSELYPDRYGVVMTDGDDDRSFQAHRDGVSLDFTTWRHDGRTFAMYELRRMSVPYLDPVLLLAVAAPTALLGWLIGCRLHRRARSSTGKAVRGAALAAGVLAVVPAAVVMIAARRLPALGHEPDAPWWYSVFVVAGDHPYAYLTVIVVLAPWLALRPVHDGWQRYEIG